MKKILTLLGTIGLTAIGASNVMAMAPIQKQVDNQKVIQNDSSTIDGTRMKTNLVGDGNIANENEWNGINSNLTVKVPASGTHKDDDDDAKSILTNTNEISWDNIISKSDTLKVNGTFELATYKEPVKTNKLILNLENSSINERTYSYHGINDKWTGWGHQTSQIDIAVKVRYANNAISIVLTNHVYIRTISSVHKSHTTSNISSVTWLR